MQHYHLNQLTTPITKVELYADNYGLGGMVLYGQQEQVIHQIGKHKIRGQYLNEIKRSQTVMLDQN